MPRPKTQADDNILDAAHRLIHAEGPDALTFARMSEICGLSPSTLVQRFKTKAELLQKTLLRAWDKLDEKTAELATTTPRTPEGAIALLVALSRNYGGIETYADGLLVLREDFRDPALRARGAVWKATLSKALDDCFVALPNAPDGIGMLVAAQWQGLLLWWGFEPRGTVETYVEEGLARFMIALSVRWSAGAL
jgi:AcrR family transcriptional regulator